MRWMISSSLSSLVATVVALSAYLSAATVNAAAPDGRAPVTEAEVNAAQQAWCDGLVRIGKVYADGGDYSTEAGQLIDALYDYKDGKVFFKPTLSSGKNTFRNTRAGALSYFVGGNKSFPEDTGFALKKWVKVRYDNNAADNGIQIHGDIAITMGNVYLTNAKGETVMVDKTFAFRRCADGKLRLCAHKSALPFDSGK
ncbi:phosphoribosyl-AMP cyclohydrolase [soil metagenome]